MTMGSFVGGIWRNKSTLHTAILLTVILVIPATLHAETLAQTSSSIVSTTDDSAQAARFFSTEDVHSTPSTYSTSMPLTSYPSEGAVTSVEADDAGNFWLVLLDISEVSVVCPVTSIDVYSLVLEVVGTAEPVVIEVRDVKGVADWVVDANTRPVIFSEDRPTRKANISLKIIKEYIPDFEDLNSEASKNLISKLSHELSDICRRADPQNFRDVKIIRLLRGSIIVKSVAQYNYPNNQSQIEFLNKDLELSLTKLFNNSDLLKHLSEALGNVSVQDAEVLMQTAEITNVSELKPLMSCNSDFANYTLNIVEGVWVCEGPCKSNPGYCNDHGDCVNVKTGPMCLCYKSSFQEYYGSQCELFHRGAGFYAALFGSLGAVLLLFIIVTIVIVVVQLRRRRCWSMSSSHESKRSNLFDDYFFDFTDRSQACQLQKYSLHDNLPEAEAGMFRTHLKNVDMT
ncbi:hypothetical protein PDJAM_G00121120 [Pangasius djambal]|uniref:Uncharacterized protein n=1 Tax=Pangasius djambal TaxID=1691987 RepID=A0ACC5Z9Y8_9TELE|nr:hypothetical protein [Pangasius djambal]